VDHLLFASRKNHWMAPMGRPSCESDRRDAIPEGPFGGYIEGISNSVKRSQKKVKFFLSVIS
jgi:hypothetical protein